MDDKRTAQDGGRRSSGLIVAAGLGMLLAGSGSAYHDSRPVTVGNCGVQVTKPTDLTIACGDGNDYLKSLMWTVWSGAEAKGTGTEEVNDCKPYCAAGRFHSYPVAVTLDLVESDNFTRIRLHYTGARPPNTPQDVLRTLQ